MLGMKEIEKLLPLRASRFAVVVGFNV